MRSPPAIPADDRQPGWEARLFEALPVAALYLHRDVIHGANAEADALFGAAPGGLLGRCAFSLVDPPDVELARTRHLARHRGEHPPERYEITLLRLDGQKVRVEIEPRVFGEGEMLLLVLPRHVQARDRALLAALGELAARVQQERTLNGVARVGAKGLRDLGFNVGVFRVEDGMTRVEAAEMSPPLRALMDRFVPGGVETLQMPLEDMLNVPRVLEEGRAVFLDEAATSMRHFLGKLGQEPPPGFDSLLQGAAMSKLVLAPIAGSAGPRGFLVVGAERLGSHDAAAISLFASQFGAAMEVAATIERLEEQNQKLEAIKQVAMLGEGRPLDELIPRILQTVTEATASKAACLYLVDAEAQSLILTGVWNYQGPLTERYRRLPLAATATGTTALSQQPRSISIEEWPEVSRADMVEAGCLENAIIPLVVNGRMGGTINLSRTDRRRYTGQELLDAQMLASQVALQLERARHAADARRRVDQLSLINEVGALINQHLDFKAVLGTAMRHLSRIAEVKNTFLLLLTDDGQALRMAASNDDHPQTPGVVIPVTSASAASEAVRNLAPTVIENTRTDPRASKELAERYGHKALLAVPLISEGRAVGALVLGETRSQRRFSAEEIDRSMAIANQLASAVENARLYEAERRRVEHLEVLVDISRLITGSLELPQILEEAAHGLVRMIDATDSFIFLLEDHLLKGVVTSAPEYKDHFASVRLTLSEPSAVASAILTRRPVRFEDAQGSVEVNQALNSRYRMKSLLALPLLLREVPMGAIAIGDRGRHRAFSDDEVELALLVARQVSVAIDNAKLFDDLKRSYLELSRAQKELVRRERLVALGELSAVVAHEVRNPLGVIFNSLVSLKRLVPQEGDAKMLLGIVGEEADRLNRMVGDLLDFARPNEPMLRPERLDEVVAGALEAAARAMPAPHVRILQELDQTLPLVPADPQMVRQAVVNLVVNAVQALPRGGTVTVRTGLEHRGTSRFARLEVEDDGPGIPPEVLDQVFMPFFTTKAAGTGLGLAVVKRIADAHRAELTVQSEKGCGSTFTLLLPLAG